MASGELFSLRVLISGKVQGVGYRLWTVRQAKSLGLKGWVRNLPDDGVEAVFSGDRQRSYKWYNYAIKAQGLL
jgi:acylphosphatase